MCSTEYLRNRKIVISDGITDLKKEFDSLVSEAKAFFEEVDRDRHGRLREDSWYDLPTEQRARAKDIRHRIRLRLARLATPIHVSPLLDKQDFRKFVRVGRAMDAALHFRAYRRTGVSDPDDPPNASWVFDGVSEELAELLDLVPERVSVDEAAASEPSPAPAQH